MAKTPSKIEWNVSKQVQAQPAFRIEEGVLYAFGLLNSHICTLLERLADECHIHNNATITYLAFHELEIDEREKMAWSFLTHRQQIQKLVNAKLVGLHPHASKKQYVVLGAGTRLFVLRMGETQNNVIYHYKNDSHFYRVFADGRLMESSSNSSNALYWYLNLESIQVEEPTESQNTEENSKGVKVVIHDGIDPATTPFPW